jgi:hypothetical protein
MAEESPAPPKTEPTPPEKSDERPILDSWVFARFDEIHAAASRWRDELFAAAESLDTAQSVAAQLVRLPQIEATLTSVFAKLRTLQTSLPLTPADEQKVTEDYWLAGGLTDLELIWQRIVNEWPPDPTKPAQAIAKMKECANHLDEMAFICKGRTLTPNINDILKNVEVGYELNLEFVFGAEFPRNPDLRKRLILGLAQERGVLKSALVDLVRGVIYRLPDKGRWRRYLPAPVLVLFFFAVLAALPYGQRLYSTWPFGPEQRYQLITNYMLWIAGAFAHVLIQTLRQSRAPTVPAFAVMDHWALWINIKQRSICVGILWISIGFVFLSCLSHDLDWKTMLFAGYSADSLTDLFVQRFELAADTAQKTLIASITPDSKSPAS